MDRLPHCSKVFGSKPDFSSYDLSSFYVPVESPVHEQTGADTFIIIMTLLSLWEFLIQTCRKAARKDFEKSPSLFDFQLFFRGVLCFMARNTAYRFDVVNVLNHSIRCSIQYPSWTRNSVLCWMYPWPINQHVDWEHLWPAQPFCSFWSNFAKQNSNSQCMHTIFFSNRKRSCTVKIWHIHLKKQLNKTSEWKLYLQMV